MKLGIYSVRDGAVDAFLPPFTCRTDGEAKRMFVAACLDPNKFEGNLADYALFRLGVFDDGSGGLVTLSSPEMVLTALEAKAISSGQ